MAPLTEQMPGVVDAKATVRPDVAVAVRPTVWFATKDAMSAGSVKVIDWFAGLIAKLWLTSGAGL